MRIGRLFGVVLTILTTGLLLASPVGAQPPSKLLDHLTDDSGVLTSSDKAAVNSAIDRLSQHRHMQLWVVYVDNFNRFQPDNWADKTRTASAMGDNDVLLAVATNTKKYAFSVPPKTQGTTADELNSLRSNMIDPAIDSKDWRGAALAAANGLDNPASATSSSKRILLWIAIGVGVLVIVIVVVLILLFLRARRRRRAARPVGPSGGQPNLDGRVDSLGPALSTAEARVRQISDYITRHHASIGAEARTRLGETQQSLAAAHSKGAVNAAEALVDANRASTLAAQAQTLANADVLAAHRTPQRRGTAGP